MSCYIDVAFISASHNLSPISALASCSSAFVVYCGDYCGRFGSSIFFHDICYYIHSNVSETF